MGFPIALGIGTALASLVSGNQQSRAAARAANIQSESAQAGIDEQRRQFESVRSLLNPYATGGASAFQQQLNLLGLGQDGAQGDALQQIEQSDLFQSIVGQQEDAILQNASATGGLRGGNVQTALSKFRPQLLNSLLQQQLAHLGEISSIGQNAAAGVGNVGVTTGNNVSQLIQQQGAAEAGGVIERANHNPINGILSGLGAYATAPGGI